MQFHNQCICEMLCFNCKQDTISRVRTHLIKIRHIQDTLRAFEARDRNTAEGNFVRVNCWSMIQIAVMLLVGLIQVRREKILLPLVDG